MKIRVVLTILWIGILLLLIPIMGTSAQVVITSTPAQVRLASITPAPLSTEVTQESDFAISGDTATPRGIIMLEPLSEVNVRTSPEISEDNRIGAIRAGERYMVLGQYFNWVQFQYDLAPDQRAWVYRDLVTIIGDEASIPTLVPGATPTTDSGIVDVTQTQEAILAQPGGVLTITAQARVIELPPGAVVEDENPAAVFSNETPLPTFTYPPGVLVGVPTLDVTRDVLIVNETTTDSDAIVAPIIPILGLGAFGILGLMLSLLRR